MPSLIEFAILAACTSIVVLALVLVASAFFIKARVMSLEASAIDLKMELAALLCETRGLVKETQAVIARIPEPLEDVEYIARRARDWTARADRIVNVVGGIAETPLVSISKYFGGVGGILSGVLQMLLGPKR